MFNKLQHTTFAGDAALSADNRTSLAVLLQFIGDKIQGLSIYYSQSSKPVKEESINSIFVQYFNSQLLAEKEGDCPFSFDKHPADDDSQSEPDFGVVILNPSKPEEPIFEIEAKRLSENISSNHQYVYGQNRGAIERFKKLKHGRKISYCGIVGYVQTRTCLNWLDKINSWIGAEISSSQDAELTWENQDLLNAVRADPGDRYIYAKSISKRIDNTQIELYHYLINLSD